VTELVGWVGRMGGRPVEIRVCDRADPDSACGPAAQPGDRIDIALRYPYGESPLVPLLPGLRAVIPDALHAYASAGLDGVPGPSGAGPLPEGG